MNKVILMCLVFLNLNLMAQSGDGILAMVNGEAITFYEVISYNRYYEHQLSTKLTGDALKKGIASSRREAARTLIDNKLLILEFDEKGYAIPTAMIEEQLDEAVVKHSGGDRALFKKNLRTYGDTMSDYKKKLRDKIAIRMMLSQFVYGEIDVTAEEIDNYIEEHHADFTLQGKIHVAVIVIKPEGRYKGKVDAVCKEVVTKLKNKEDFASVAKAYSEGPNVDAGGDMGWMADDDINPAFKEAAKRTIIGECSEFITMDNNFKVLFKVIDHEEGKSTAMEDTTHSKVKRILEQKQQKLKKDKFIDTLRSHNIVKEYF